MMIPPGHSFHGQWSTRIGAGFHFSLCCSSDLIFSLFPFPKNICIYPKTPPGQVALLPSALLHSQHHQSRIDQGRFHGYSPVGRFLGSAAELPAPVHWECANPLPAVTQFLCLGSWLFFLQICFKPGESFLYTYWVSSFPHTLPLLPTPLQTTQDPPHFL